MMVAEMLGVVNDVFPLSKAEPPEAAAYQSMVSPAPAVAKSVSVPAPQREAPVPLGAEGLLFIDAVTAARLEDTQPVVVLRASA